jgi:hypothetical protein
MPAALFWDTKYAYAKRGLATSFEAQSRKLRTSFIILAVLDRDYHGTFAYSALEGRSAQLNHGPRFTFHQLIMVLLA